MLPQMRCHPVTTSGLPQLSLVPYPPQDPNWTTGMVAPTFQMVRRIRGYASHRQSSCRQHVHPGVLSPHYRQRIPI